jgi:hypothetical protein
MGPCQPCRIQRGNSDQGIFIIDYVRHIQCFTSYIDFKLQINDAGGTKTLFEWYADMNPWVQLEALAALTNLTLSVTITQEMVMKYKCIDFFMGMISSNKPLHSQFASIALGNIARDEVINRRVPLFFLFHLTKI